MKNIYNVAIQTVLHVFVGLSAIGLAGVLAYQHYPRPLILAGTAIMGLIGAFVVITWLLYFKATWDEVYI